MALVCCKPVGQFFCPEDRPSPIFSTFGVLINALGAVWGIIRLALADYCRSDRETWVILGIISHFIHIAFCFYIYFRFAHKVRTEHKAASEAAWKLFLYDWGVCLYILFTIWMIVWVAIVAGKDGGDSCGSQLTISMVLFIIYYVVGSILICFSIMTEGCREPTWQRQNQQQAAYAANPTTGVVPANYVVQAQPMQAQPAQAQPAYGQPYGYPAQAQPAYAQPRQTPPPASNPNYRV